VKVSEGRKKIKIPAKKDAMATRTMSYVVHTFPFLFPIREISEIRGSVLSSCGCQEPPLGNRSNQQGG
jgi:hypothetical protein